MRQFFSFVTKEFYHIFRDRWTMMILLGMPIIQIILFGFAITTEVKNVQVAVLDPIKDQFTRRLTERIDASEYMDVTLYLNSSKELDEVFRKNRADLVVVFSDRFSDNLYHTGEAAIQLVTDATDPNKATTLAGYAANIIANVQQEELQGAAQQQTPVIVPHVQMLYNPRMESSYNFVPGVMGLILMLICAMMTSISIVREKEMGTMEVLLVSPIRPIFVVVAKAVPYFVLSCVNIASILLLSRFALRVPVAGNLFLLIAVCLLYILVSLSLGLLVSTLTQKQMSAILFSGMVLMMPVMMLSGMIFPVENMPAILQWISHLIPARWFIAAVRKVMIQGVGFVYIAKEVAVLAAMAVVLLTVSTRLFKVRL